MFQAGSGVAAHAESRLTSGFQPQSGHHVARKFATCLTPARKPSNSKPAATEAYQLAQQTICLDVPGTFDKFSGQESGDFRLCKNYRPEAIASGL